MTNSENKIEHIIKDNGTEIWKDSNENLHQHDDVPATIYPNGTEIYYKNGIPYRKLGPRTKHPNGYEIWNTKKSCIVIAHRTNGAVRIFLNGKREYWINDRIMAYDEFRKRQIRTHNI